MVDPGTVRRAAELLADARSVLFITGAGVSADSGLPTYRGVGGLYEEQDTVEGLPIEVALSGQVMASRPALTWKYLAQIEQACRGARHNRAHEVIAAVERARPRVWVLTQNVDGFHRTAGSENVIDIHGDLHQLLCPRCGHLERVEHFGGLAIPPPCPACAGILRPDVVLFGELLPEAKVDLLERELRRGFDLVLTIGTSAAFPYIAAPVLEARRRGTPTIEIDPGRTPLSPLVDLQIPARAAPALDAIWAATNPDPE